MSCGTGKTVSRVSPYMSHHYSGPAFGFPHHDARLDITDLFAFHAGDAHVAFGKRAAFATRGSLNDVSPTLPRRKS